MSMHMLHTRRRRIPSDPSAAFGEGVQTFDPSPPPAFDRPHGASNIVATSPVTNVKLGNDQEMQSGADVKSGVMGSSISGGDYSREQGVGRAPGWRWPFNFHSMAFNINSLDRWNLERQDSIDLPPGLNVYEGVPEHPYSPIAAMDQLTTYYENDPNQWYYFSPPPVTLPDSSSPAYAEQAVLW
jgi:hypothetical protein